MEKPNNTIVIREFEVEGIKYKLIKPTAYILREAKYKYTKVFTEALKSGFLTKKKLDLVLKETSYNIIQEHINKRAEMLKAYADTESTLNKTSDPEQIEYLAELLTIYRQSLIQEDLSMNNLYSNTAEQLAEDDRLNYLTANLIVDSNNNKLWPDYESFLEDPRYEFIELVKYQIMCWEYNLDPNWKEGLPEELARKKASDIRAAAVEELAKKDIISTPKRKAKKAIKSKANKKINKEEVIHTS